MGLDTKIPPKCVRRPSVASERALRMQVALDLAETDCRILKIELQRMKTRDRLLVNQVADIREKTIRLDHIRHQLLIKLGIAVKALKAYGDISNWIRSKCGKSQVWNGGDRGVVRALIALKQMTDE